jgi:pimeloyl-ACP methyl ester carboxylesterase
VIGGRNDLPGFQEAHYSATIANWLRNVRFHYVTDAGHYPMQETPVLFANLIEGHFTAAR